MAKKNRYGFLEPVVTDMQRAQREIQVPLGALERFLKRPQIKPYVKGKKK